MVELTRDTTLVALFSAALLSRSLVGLAERPSRGGEFLMAGKFSMGCGRSGCCVISGLTFIRPLGAS